MLGGVKREKSVDWKTLQTLILLSFLIALNDRIWEFWDVSKKYP